MGGIPRHWLITGAGDKEKADYPCSSLRTTAKHSSNTALGQPVFSSDISGPPA